MYYEDPEVNDERQYDQYCLDNNGKAIYEDKDVNFSLIGKINIEKAAKDYQGNFEIDNGDSAMSGYTNGKHNQSYDSFKAGSYFLLKHIEPIMIEFAEYYYSYWSLSDYFPESKTTKELLDCFLAKTSFNKNTT